MSEREDDTRADGNLFEGSEPPAIGERFETLRWIGGVHLERIVSSASPEPGVYEQPHAEWVVLLRGGATVVIGERRIVLGPGDHIFLPAGAPHTVERTEPGTVWLAVHVHPSPGSAS